MLELVHLQPQNDFPENDITADNAAMLKFMLSDPSIREYAHEEAEKAVLLYRMSHIALREVLNPASVFNSQGGEWFNYGIVQYEAAADLLRITLDNRPRYSHDVVSAQYLTALMKAGEQEDYFDKAHTKLVNEQPIFCEVIEEVTKETIGANRTIIDHALFGAAVQRQVELDAKFNFETEEAFQKFLTEGFEF